MKNLETLEKVANLIPKKTNHLFHSGPLILEKEQKITEAKEVTKSIKSKNKAIAMRFKASPCVLDCIKGSYAGLFRGFNFNHVILSLKSKLHFSFTNVPLAVH